jgi:N utilization substance protein A
VKSDFLLAFNQVCSDRGLSKEVVLDALQTALESAYRRNAGIEMAQNVVATIDMETGKAQVFVEKQVVEEITDPQQEISLADARARQPDAELEGVVMIESTPKDFGRIAAQNAKQIFLQRSREAEREARYAHYVQQEGEIVHGTVQSIKPQVVTLHLEGTEAILPRSQQVPGERYTLHQRLRTYVLEVRKTNRGPQIVVSRSHRNMLRRLLELEVPEIFNGAVEIKSISREAGSRSKVAVAARQAGVDPVGACVGMRGVRIQSIVNELGGEKIDVIEWNPDVTTFIAKSLSPAKVLSVQLQEGPVDGKTANVVVPDDQLSLAIGRGGQNARLAAKLTGWRIDIQGVTEAATWALKQVNEDPNVLPALGLVAELLPNVASILRQHEQEKLPYHSQELLAMRQVIEGVSSYYAAIRNAERARRMAEEAARRAVIETAAAERRSVIKAALALIPPQAYEIPLPETDLSARVLGHLQRAELATIGDVMERLAEGDEGLLKLDGIGPKSLTEVKRCLKALQLPEVEVEIEPEPEVVAEEAVAEEVAGAVEAGEEVEVLAPVPLQAYDISLPYIGLGKRVLSSLEQFGLVTVGDVMGRLAEGSESFLELDGIGPEELAKIKQCLEALAALVSEEDVPAAEEPEAIEEAPVEEPLVVEEPAELFFEGEEDLEGRTKEDDRRRRRQLVLDEESGEVVALRLRKRGDDADAWEDHLR